MARKSRAVIWKAACHYASSEVIAMNRNRKDTIISIKIVKLLKESGMEPLDAIICLHGIESAMLTTIRDLTSDDESEVDEE